MLHVLPSHVHVSFAKLDPAPPPNSKTWLVAASNTIACPDRADGLFAGVLCVQLSPSHIHVSLVAAAAELLPPKSTIWPLAKSNVIEWPQRAEG